MIRELVSIDEDLCNGCGECVPSCAEGAIQIVNGKARLMSDVLCDGLGACLGHCPQGAISIERRDGAAFDEAVVQEHLAASAVGGNGAGGANGRGDAKPGPNNPIDHAHGGCPSSRFNQLLRRPGTASAEPKAGCDAQGPPSESELSHWPIQLRLLPPTAPGLQHTPLLVSADCVPFAYPDFHSKMLRDHALVIACPKLDDPRGYVEKLAEMFRHNDPPEITVARMEVPCCGGILRMVIEAREEAGIDVPVNDVVVGVGGQVIAKNTIPVRSTTSGDIQPGPARCPTTGAN